MNVFGKPRGVADASLALLDNTPAGGHPASSARDVSNHHTNVLVPRNRDFPATTAADRNVSSPAHETTQELRQTNTDTTQLKIALQSTNR
jgi:hypothetical protein